MTTSRFIALILMLVTLVWFAWGYVKQLSSEKPAITERLSQSGTQKPFKVAVEVVKLAPHSRKLTLSGRTESDKRASAISRTSGTIVDLNIKRGSRVKEGDVLVVLSDEARESTVKKAQARLEQRQNELKARLKLIAQGSFPAINKTQLEAELKDAEANLAQAKAEFARGRVVAPIDGIVNDVPVELGQALQVGQIIADIISPDPMLAVAEIAERQLKGVRVGTLASVRLVSGETREGTVRFISAKASNQTRTYRLEVDIKNTDALISDGMTAEVTVMLNPLNAARIPRSSLTFSSEGKLGVRTVDGTNNVVFTPVVVLDDASDVIYVSGLSEGQRLIVQGQDFVKEGAVVEPIAPLSGL